MMMVVVVQCGVAFIESSFMNESDTGRRSRVLSLRDGSKKTRSLPRRIGSSVAGHQSLSPVMAMGLFSAWPGVSINNVKESNSFYHRLENKCVLRHISNMKTHS